MRSFSQGSSAPPASLDRIGAWKRRRVKPGIRGGTADVAPLASYTARRMVRWRLSPLDVFHPEQPRSPRRASGWGARSRIAFSATPSRPPERPSRNAKSTKRTGNLGHRSRPFKNCWPPPRNGDAHREVVPTGRCLRLAPPSGAARRLTASHPSRRPAGREVPGPSNPVAAAVTRDARRPAKAGKLRPVGLQSVTRR